MSEARDELTQRVYDAFDLPVEARAALDAQVAAWQAMRDAEDVWTGEMLMAISKVCEDLAAELTEVLGVPIHVQFDPLLARSDT